MKKDRANTTPKTGRGLFDFKIGTGLSIKDRVTIDDLHGNTLESVYLGPSKKSVRQFERFRFSGGHIFPINAMVDVSRNKKTVGRFMVANYRISENTIILIKEKNLPCID